MISFMHSKLVLVLIVSINNFLYRSIVVVHVYVVCVLVVLLQTRFETLQVDVNK